MYITTKRLGPHATWYSARGDMEKSLFAGAPSIWARAVPYKLRHACFCIALFCRLPTMTRIWSRQPLRWRRPPALASRREFAWSWRHQLSTEVSTACLWQHRSRRQGPRTCPKWYCIQDLLFISFVGWFEPRARFTADLTNIHVASEHPSSESFFWFRFGGSSSGSPSTAKAMDHVLRWVVQLENRRTVATPSGCLSTMSRLDTHVASSCDDRSIGLFKAFAVALIKNTCSMQGDCVCRLLPRRSKIWERWLSVCSSPMTPSTADRLMEWKCYLLIAMCFT